MQIVLVLLATTAGLLFAFFAGCAETPPASPSPIALEARDMQFDRDILVAPTGRTVTVALEDRDIGVQHNLAVSTDASARVAPYRGPVVTGSGYATCTITPASTPGRTSSATISAPTG